MTNVGIAGHLVGGQIEPGYFWIGLPNLDPRDWYDWSADMGPHRGSVRWGHNGDNYGADALIGSGRDLWQALIDSFPAGMVEEIWFGPKFSHLRAMIRIHVFNPGDRGLALQFASRAIHQVFGQVKLDLLDPMS